MQARLFATLFILSVVLYLTGCKKSPGNPRFTGIYKPGPAFIINGPPVMYTRNSTITDQQIIESFLTKWMPSHQFNSLNPAESPATTLEFLENDLVKVTTNEMIGTHTVHAYISERSNNHLVIMQLDSNFYVVTGYDTCAEMIKRINGIDKITTCRQFTYSQQCKTRPVFTLKLEGDRIYQYMVTTLVKNTYTSGFPGAPPQEYGCTQTIHNSWDNFDPAVIQTIGNRDTVVIQSKKIQLIKQ